MKHVMNVSKVPFDKIANGTKKIESRIFDCGLAQTYFVGEFTDGYLTFISNSL